MRSDSEELDDRTRKIPEIVKIKDQVPLPLDDGGPP
jgi:hypothetical protein